jgi:hypothetical protein
MTTIYDNTPLGKFLSSRQPKKINALLTKAPSVSLKQAVVEAANNSTPDAVASSTLCQPTLMPQACVQCDLCARATVRFRALFETKDSPPPVVAKGEEAATWPLELLFQLCILFACMGLLSIALLPSSLLTFFAAVWCSPIRIIQLNWTNLTALSLEPFALTLAIDILFVVHVNCSLSCVLNWMFNNYRHNHNMLQKIECKLNKNQLNKFHINILPLG